MGFWTRDGLLYCNWGKEVDMIGTKSVGVMQKVYEIPFHYLLFSLKSERPDHHPRVKRTVVELVLWGNRRETEVVSVEEEKENQRKQLGRIGWKGCESYLGQTPQSVSLCGFLPQHLRASRRRASRRPIVGSDAGLGFYQVAVMERRWCELVENAKRCLTGWNVGSKLGRECWQER